MATIIGQQEVQFVALQSTPSYQAVGTVQASPAPTTTTFTVNPITQPFRPGEAWLAGQGVYIQSYNNGVVTISPPLSAPPTAGQTLEQDEQFATVGPLTATGTSLGRALDVGGYNGAQSLEIVNTGAGTATVTIQGSNGQLDNAGNQIWYSVGYQQVDGVAAPARSVATIAVGAGNVTTFAHSYQVLDLYRYIRAQVTGATAGISLYVYFVGVPV